MCFTRTLCYVESDVFKSHFCSLPDGWKSGHFHWWWVEIVKWMAMETRARVGSWGWGEATRRSWERQTRQTGTGTKPVILWGHWERWFLLFLLLCSRAWSGTEGSQISACKGLSSPLPQYLSPLPWVLATLACWASKSISPSVQRCFVPPRTSLLCVASLRWLKGRGARNSGSGADLGLPKGLCPSSLKTGYRNHLPWTILAQICRANAEGVWRMSPSKSEFAV